MNTSETFHSIIVRARTVLVPIAVGIASHALLGPSVASAAGPSDLFAKASNSATVAVDHGAWDALLKTYVKPGTDGLNRVDYESFKRAGHGQLKAYIEQIQRVDVTKLDRSEQFALLANLYNAKTIEIVLSKYPVKSIKDISLGGGLTAAFTGGPWKAKVVKLNGVDMSLDDIEHGVLRPVFKDSRVHYAVNCASVGCPNLQREAFVGARLEAQLDAAASAFVNSPRGIRIVNDQVTASSIYDWFKADFGGNEQGVLQHARHFAAPALSRKLTAVNGISSFAYDWSLNDTKR